MSDLAIINAYLLIIVAYILICVLAFRLRYVRLRLEGDFRRVREVREHPPIHISAQGVSSVRASDVLASGAGRREIERAAAADLTRRGKEVGDGG